MRNYGRCDGSAWFVTTAGRQEANLVSPYFKVVRHYRPGPSGSYEEDWEGSYAVDTVAVEPEPENLRLAVRSAKGKAARRLLSRWIETVIALGTEHPEQLMVAFDELEDHEQELVLSSIQKAIDDGQQAARIAMYTKEESEFPLALRSETSTFVERESPAHMIFLEAKKVMEEPGAEEERREFSEGIRKAITYAVHEGEARFASKQDPRYLFPYIFLKEASIVPDLEDALDEFFADLGAGDCEWEERGRGD